MPYSVARVFAIAAILGAGTALSACAQSRLRLAPDFGEAVRQDVAAQIADPDAHYAGTPAPASNGERTAIAQRRYVTHTVLEPPSTSISVSGGGGGGGGGGGSSGGGSAMSQAVGAP